MTISIIIPFYNESGVINHFINDLEKQLKLIKEYKFEIIFIDNDSQDGSDSYVKQIAKRKKYIYLKQNRNFGYQANILAGYLNSTGECVIQIDSDGQDDPSLIPKLILKWKEGYDVVYGIRKKRNESIITEFQRKVFYRILNKLSDINIPLDSGDFRLVDRKVIKQLKNFNEKNIYLRGIFSYIGGKQTGIEYERKSRLAGESKFSWFKYASFALNALLSFSNKPLKTVGILCFITSIFGILGIIYYFILFLLDKVYIQGFTTVIIVILFLITLLMFALGIISFYLSEILIEVKSRPTYILNENENINHRK